jgi:hypothetical protein
MAGRRQTTPEQEAEIWDGFRQGRSGSQIHREMELKGLLFPPHPNVTVRLVQSRLHDLQEMTPPDESGPWCLSEAEPDEAALVLDVVADVFDSTQGRVWPSRAHVAEIARLRRVVPEIPADWADSIAQAYQRCAAEGRDARYLDFALGARPWETAERADWFARLLGKPLPAESHGVDSDSQMALLRLMTYKGSLEDMRDRFPDYSRDAIPEPRVPPPRLPPPRLSVATPSPPDLSPEGIAAVFRPERRTSAKTDVDTLVDTLTDGQP